VPTATATSAAAATLTPTATRRPSTFRQYRILLGKDLRREFRTREMLTSMGIYAVLVLIVFGTALMQASAGFDVLPVAGGLIWALIVFTSLLGLNRSFSHEKEEAALEGIMLVPLDRSVIFLAKASANVLFLLVVEIITLPLFYFLFLSGSALAATFGLAIVPLLVGTIGIAGVGTLLATITVNTRGQDVLLAVLFVPLVFPLLYACVAATSVALLGGEDMMATFGPAVALAAAYDVIMILVSWLLYDFIISA
jgi:heme exporter protein B